MKKAKDFKKAKEVANQTVINAFKILSSIFDANGGIIEIDEEIFENADIRFHVKGEAKNGKVILEKVLGESEICKNLFEDNLN